MTSEYRLLPVEWLTEIWRPDSFFKNAKSVTFQVSNVYINVINPSICQLFFKPPSNLQRGPNFFRKGQKLILHIIYEGNLTFKPYISPGNHIHIPPPHPTNKCKRGKMPHCPHPVITLDICIYLLSIKDEKD